MTSDAPILEPDPILEAEPRTVRWGIGDAIGGLITSLVFSTAAALVLIALGYDEPLEVWSLVPTIVAGWAGFVLWLAIASYVKGSRSLDVDFGLRSQRWDMLRGIGSAVLTLLVVGVFSRMLGDDVGDPTFGAVEPRGFAEFAALGLCIIVGAPVIEELFFRGLLLRALQRRVGSFGAIVISSLVFGGLHVPQREALGLLQALMPLLVIGLVLAWLAVRYERLGPAIYAHMTINGLGFLGLFAS